MAAALQILRLYDSSHKSIRVGKNPTRPRKTLPGFAVAFRAKTRWNHHVLRLKSAAAALHCKYIYPCCRPCVRIECGKLAFCGKSVHADRHMVAPSFAVRWGNHPTANLKATPIPSQSTARRTQFESRLPATIQPSLPSCPIFCHVPVKTSVLMGLSLRSNSYWRNFR